jgi:hypothetical protein
MEKYNIAICDDSEMACRNNKEKLVKFADEYNLFFEIDVFMRPDDFRARLAANPYYYDAIFLDVEFTNAHKSAYGIVMGNWIRDILNNQVTTIVFVSRYKMYREKSYLYANPLSYVLKSADDEQLFAVLKRWITIFKKQENIFFKYTNDYTPKRILNTEIIYLGLENRMIRMKTKDRWIAFNSTVKDCYEQLERYDFIVKRHAPIGTNVKLKSYSSCR